MTPKQMIKRLEALKAQQAKLRDRLRELEAEASEHISNADDAMESIDYACDALSRLV